MPQIKVAFLICLGKEFTGVTFKITIQAQSENTNNSDKVSYTMPLPFFFLPFGSMNETQVVRVQNVIFTISSNNSNETMSLNQISQINRTC